MFTGRWWDSTTKLYHYRARDYSPALGRFLQPDPIGYADSMNLYQYCGNNPVNWIDPWGLYAKGPWWVGPLEKAVAVIGAIEKTEPYLTGIRNTAIGGAVTIAGFTAAVGTGGVSEIATGGSFISGGMAMFGVGLGQIIVAARGGNADNVPASREDALIQIVVGGPKKDAQEPKASEDAGSDEGG